MAKPAAYCAECGLPSTPERHESGPQVIHHLASCSEHPDHRPEPADDDVAVADLQPGQRVLIYTDVVVTVEGVDRLDTLPGPDPYVTLRYVRHYAQGSQPGCWTMPATWRLPLAP